MPGRSGYDLCASIKADPALRAVPVFILASSQQPYDDARGQKAGADGQLTKPWETNAMMDKVRDVLAPGRAEAARGRASAGRARSRASACGTGPGASVRGVAAHGGHRRRRIRRDQHRHGPRQHADDSARGTGGAGPQPVRRADQQPIHGGGAGSRRAGASPRDTTAPGLHHVAWHASLPDPGDAAGRDAAGTSGHGAGPADRRRAAAMRAPRRGRQPSQSAAR